MSFFRALHGVIFDRTMNIGTPRARRRISLHRPQTRNRLGGHNISSIRNQASAQGLSSVVMCVSPVPSCHSPIDVSIDDTTPYEPDRDLENQTKSETNSGARRLSLV